MKKPTTDEVGDLGGALEGFGGALRSDGRGVLEGVWGGFGRGLGGLWGFWGDWRVWGDPGQF